MTLSNQNITEELLLLYELSLSIGQSLDVRANCRNFLKVLLSRRNLSGASIWWVDEKVTSSSAPLVLLEAIPRCQPDNQQLLIDNPLWQLTRNGKPRVFSASDSAYDHILTKNGFPKGSIAVFPLGRQGLLKLDSSLTDRFSTRSINQMRAVVEKLSVAIQGAFAHARVQESEDAVKRSEKQLRTILDNVDACIYLKDSGRRYVFANHAVRQLLHADMADILGKTDDLFFDPITASNIHAVDQRVLVHGETLRLEETNTALTDGKLRIFQSTKLPLCDEAGDIYALCGISSEITDRKLVEVALAEREEQFRVLIEAVPDSIQLKDGKGRWLVANSNCLNLFGFNSDTWKGLTDLEIGLQHPHLAKNFASCQASDELAWIHGGVLRTEETVSTENGKQIHFDVFKVPLFDEAGARRALVIVSRDVTVFKQIQIELEQHRTHLEELVQQRTNELIATEARASHIIQASSDGLFGTDTNGNITFINQAGYEMLGYLPEEMIGKHAHSLFHSKKPDGTPYPFEECPSHKARKFGSRTRIDSEVYWHAKGHPVPVMYAVHPIQQGRDMGEMGAVTSFVDITIQRAAIEAREAALIAAENLAQVRRQFLSNMSHEIRTPLNGVIGFAHIGLRNVLNSAKAQGAFEQIITSGNRLIAVVNDILDFSKIEAGKLNIEHVDVCLRTVIDQTVEIVREKLFAKQLNFRTTIAPDVPKSIISDPLRLGQVLLNLLNNAVKFTDSGSISLTLGIHDGKLVFSIADTGIGMSEEQTEFLFNPFHQADASSTRKFGGTGLGLAISKRILELMDGDITVQSALNAGSIFKFSIPCIPSQETPTPSASSDANETMALAGMTILVVEDDFTNQLVLKEYLDYQGATMVLATNGREAIEAVENQGGGAFDIVLMDIQMPEMGGYEATQRILELTPDLPIIGQTAHALAEEQKKCLAVGMVDHIAKPIDPDSLLSLILKHTQVRRSEPDLANSKPTMGTGGGASLSVDGIAE